jgi:hypothetical protein
MFAGLPVLTETLVNEAAEKDWPYFLDLMIKCMRETSTLDEAIDSACGELKTQNPNLVKAIRGVAYGVLGLFKDRDEPERSGAAMAVVPSVLVILNLISKSQRD